MVVPECFANIPVLKLNSFSNSLEEFEKKFLKTNQPVVISNYLCQLPCANWSMKYLLDVIGSNHVTVRGKTHSNQYKVVYIFNHLLYIF